MIKAEVKASMENHNYNIEISFDLEEGVKDAYCTCPRGTVSCHHMAAVLYYAHYNISATDMQCQWSVPRAKRHHEDNIVKLKDVHQLKKPYIKQLNDVLPKRKLPSCVMTWETQMLWALLGSSDLKSPMKLP